MKGAKLLSRKFYKCSKLGISFYSDAHHAEGIMSSNAEQRDGEEIKEGAIGGLGLPRSFVFISFVKLRAGRY